MWQQDVARYWLVTNLLYIHVGEGRYIFDIFMLISRRGGRMVISVENFVWYIQGWRLSNRRCCKTNLKLVATELFSTSVELGSENVCLFVCLSVCLSVTNFWAAYLVLMTFPKLNSSIYGIFRVIPRWYYFFFTKILIFGPCRYWKPFGTKICGERSVCPMVTKLSGFGLCLGRNLMKVENLDFGHGIVLFWYWKPFWDQILGQHILSLWHFLSWTPVFLESLGLSPGGIFFLLPNFDFWALQVLETFLGPKFAERDPFVQWWPNFQDLVSI